MSKSLIILVVCIGVLICLEIVKKIVNGDKPSKFLAQAHKVEGKVLNKNKMPFLLSRAGRRMGIYSIQYTYQVDGNTYNNNDDFNSSDIFERYQVGDVIPLLYFPQSPSQSYIEDVLKIKAKSLIHWILNP